MNEELIELTTEDVIEAKVEEIINSEVNTEDLEQSITTEETVETIEIETVEEIEIDIEESVGWVGGDSTRHYSLSGRDEADQHPITSITGLREELNQIESLQTVYSDKKQQADYYLWRQDDEHPLPAHPYGLFVSIIEGTDKIGICDGLSDVFGVTVADAAFVGNQEYVQAEGGMKTGRDGNYCLVVHSGLVGVRCETTVVVGDYVVPNSRGEAKKSDGNYGYHVTALSEINGVQYAIVSLNAASVLAQTIADNVDNLGKRMHTAEYNITSVTNVANSAYALAKDAKENAEVGSKYLDEKITEVLGRMDKIDGEDGIVDNLSQSINNACSDAALAKTIANDAVSAAQQMGDDAYASANEAIAAIKDIGAGSTSWAKRLDAYSVGEYSQAYGLTWEQAKEALPNGLVHIPTITHTEIYVGAEASYGQEFSIGYYYAWNGEKWSPSLSTAVNFSSVYFIGSEQTPYWVVTDADIEQNGVIYTLGYLYKWENGAWNTTGACVAENTLTRAVSAIHQTANEISMEVTNARGDAASLDIRINKNESAVQTLAKWTGSEEGKYNLATTKVSADEEGASIALVVVKDGTDEEVGGARIVLNDSEKGSYIQFDANNINFTAEDYSVIASNIKLDGYVTFDNLAESNNQTVINGSNITTGIIDASKATIENINASQINTGQIDANLITVKNMNASFLGVDELSAISANLGLVKAGAIQSTNYTNTDDIMIWGVDEPDEIKGSEGLEYTLNDTGTGYVVVGIGTCVDTDIIIPRVYNNAPVTSIGDNAFRELSNLKSVVIPNSVTRIGVSAFAFCNNLTNVNIPDSVMSIGDYAFYTCSSLTSVVIPNGVRSIPYQMTAHCSNLTTIVIPNSVINIGYQAIYDCSNLKIYYRGSEYEWGNISIDASNEDILVNATKYYYSITNPSTDGNFWFYKNKDGFKISCEDNMIDSQYFKVASNGKITATEGTIGGWNLQERSTTHHLLYHRTNKFGTGMSSTPTENDPAFWAGYVGSGNNPWESSSDQYWADYTKFYVTNAGKLVAKDATISGAITATEGRIGKLYADDRWSDVKIYASLEYTEGFNCLTLSHNALSFTGTSLSIVFCHFNNNKILMGDFYLQDNKDKSITERLATLGFKTGTITFASNTSGCSGSLKKLGNFVIGSITFGSMTGNSTIGTLPSGFRPYSAFTINIPIKHVSGTSMVMTQGTLTFGTDGSVKLSGTNAGTNSGSATVQFGFDTTAGNY